MPVSSAELASIMTDSYGRRITDVRISVTSACNLHCLYCHREGECFSESVSGELTVDEIREITALLSEYGVKTLKITGGEPLLRRDILEVIAAIPKTMEISMTTNGVRLAEMAYDLKKAGLSRVNISIDSLRPERYAKITGRDYLRNVLDGYETACRAGLTPVKINTVILPGLNDDEINDFLAFAKGRDDTILQFIELMDMHGWTDSLGSVLKNQRSFMEELEEQFRRDAVQVVTRHMHHRRKYQLNGATVEIVRPMHNAEFCANCNRLRITSDGKLKPCLLRTGNEVLLKGLHGDDLKEALAAAVAHREPYFT